ncbi:MAG: MBL fold metallo-hydrolase [Spirochaetaceae bacterium]|jgi:phosphoribosyl 1,2-cyclic phosphodiesterase|nr:MBL fold metallo-hydrolase [Spirochaetaceae bacterium]
MRIRFWGVRGSLPAPQLPSQIKSKISAILERLTPEDVESPASRERFLAGLPPWLFGTIGGNTPCVSVHFDDSSEVIVFDTGSGIRELGLAMTSENPKPGKYHIFYSHFHWDHLCGLPFFNPAYDPSVYIHFYSPKDRLEEILCGQMIPPYFPVRMETMGSKKTYHRLEGAITLNGVRCSYKKLNHPGDSYSYRIDDGEHRFIFATDTELTARDFVKNAENSAYFQDADVVVIDSQYTLGEAIEKYNWGHSAFSLAVDFAANWNVKHLVLFHHDPGYDDRKLYNILQSARWYMERMNIMGIRISLAMEGMEVAL